MRLFRSVCLLTVVLWTIGVSPQLAQSAPFLPPTPRVVSFDSDQDLRSLRAVAIVPAGFPAGGRIQAGDILVLDSSDGISGEFNRLVRVPPTGPVSTFLQELAAGSASTETSSLAISQYGFVFIGNAIVDKNAQTVGILLPSIPFDDTVECITLVEGYGGLTVFFSPPGAATVVRLDFQVTAQGLRRLGSRQIGSGFPGAVGLAYAPDSDQLFVLTHAGIYALGKPLSAISDQGRGTLVISTLANLQGAPGGLAVAPNRNLLVSTVGHTRVLEVTRAGKEVRRLSVGIDDDDSGSANIAVSNSVLTGISQLAVLDNEKEGNENNLLIWTLP